MIIIAIYDVRYSQDQHHISESCKQWNDHSGRGCGQASYM